MADFTVEIVQEQTGFQMERVYIHLAGGDPELDRVATIHCAESRATQIETAKLFASAPAMKAALEKALKWANCDKTILAREWMQDATTALAALKQGQE